MSSSSSLAPNPTALRKGLKQILFALYQESGLHLVMPMVLEQNLCSSKKLVFIVDEAYIVLEITG